MEDPPPPRTLTKRQREEERLSEEAVRRLIEQDTADLARQNAERLSQQAASAGYQDNTSVAPDAAISSDDPAEDITSTSDVANPRSQDCNLYSWKEMQKDGNK